jgi:non-ribosomal peptide synthetase component F
LFEAQAARTPDAVAVAGEAGILSYRELNTRANRLARLLAARGAGPESVVAVVMERSAELIVALLAVVKAGAAWLPVDPGYPAERIAVMFSDARPAVTLATAAIAPDLPVPVTAQVLVVDESALAAGLGGVSGADLADADRRAVLLPAHPAYVIYTSGSRALSLPMRGYRVSPRLSWSGSRSRRAAGCCSSPRPVSMPASWSCAWRLPAGERWLSRRADCWPGTLWGLS